MNHNRDKVVGSSEFEPDEVPKVNLHAPSIPTTAILLSRKPRVCLRTTKSRSAAMLILWQNDTNSTSGNGN